MLWKSMGAALSGALLVSATGFGFPAGTIAIGMFQGNREVKKALQELRVQGYREVDGPKYMQTGAACAAGADPDSCDAELLVLQTMEKAEPSGAKRTTSVISWVSVEPGTGRSRLQLFRPTPPTP